MSASHVCHVLRFQIPDTDQLREIAVREGRRSPTTKHAPTWDPSTDTCLPPVPFVCCPDLRGFPPTQHTGYDYIHPRLGHRRSSSFSGLSKNNWCFGSPPHRNSRKSCWGKLFISHHCRMETACALSVPSTNTWCNLSNTMDTSPTPF